MSRENLYRGMKDDMSNMKWLEGSLIVKPWPLSGKDGKRIFEGDKIEFDRKEWGGNDNIHIVSWDDKEGQWNWGGGNGSSDMEFRSVIGNIHEEVSNG